MARSRREVGRADRSIAAIRPFSKRMSTGPAAAAPSVGSRVTPCRSLGIQGSPSTMGRSGAGKGGSGRASPAPQGRNSRCKSLAKAVDVLFIRRPAEAEADRARRETPGATPIAASTCEGATLPDEQAEPEEAATPPRSSRISSVAASNPGAAKAQRVGQPRRAVAEIDRVRGGAARQKFAGDRERRRAAAASRQTPAAAAARGGAEARDRRRRSRCRRARRAPARRRAAAARQPASPGAPAISAPAPCGPPNLWAERMSASAPSASASSGSRPASCAASQTSRPPRACTSAAASATGCRTPVSLLAACSATSGRLVAA